jgi:hypothetical protein
VRGQSASIHAMSSFRRQRTTRPILIGAGARPEDAYLHQVRWPMLTRADAWAAVRSSVSGDVLESLMNGPEWGWKRLVRSFMSPDCPSVSPPARNSLERHLHRYPSWSGPQLARVDVAS